MRRFLLIFLVVMMPLQLSWAAVSSYCLHESGPTSKHFGHHEHKHQQASKAGDSNQTKASKALGVVDADCHFCHACSPVILSNTEVVSSLAVEPLLATWTADAYRSDPSPRPERPNWAALA